MLPLKDTIPSRSFPLVNWTLITLNVLAFLWLADAGPQSERLVTALAFIPAAFYWICSTPLNT